MNRTYTSINWALTRQDDGTKIHTGTRAGWTFTIRTPRTSKAVLTARARDGRSSRTEHLSTQSAKEAALALMHPAEAMAWSRDGRRLLADWDVFSFVAVRNESGCWDLRIDHQTSDPMDIRNLPNVADVRLAGVQTLVDHYGPIAPSDEDRKAGAALREAEALEAALKAAGIRFTAKQLATAALVLSR